MSYSFSNAVEQQEYDEFVKKHPACNLLQSYNWFQIKENWDHLHIGMYEEQRLVASCLILIRKLIFGYSIWYIPHGPVLAYEQEDLLEQFLQYLQKTAQRGKCVLLKIDPPVFASSGKPEEFADELSAPAAQVKQSFEQLGFIHQGFGKEMKDSIQPRYVATVFAAADTAFTKRISKRTKDSLKDAKRRLVDVRRGSLEDLDSFHYLINKTEEAKNISLRNRAYFEKLFQVYSDDVFLYIAQINLPQAIEEYEQKIMAVEEKINNLPQQAPKKRREYELQIDSLQQYLQLFKEERKKTGEIALLSGCLSILYGHGFEMLYAGFNRDYSQIPAQAVVYVKSIEEAFEQGASYCSMGGISGHLNCDLLRFKLNFDPHIVAFLGEFDYPVKKFLYFIYQLALKLRRLK